jgi:hypothetical protein
MTFRISWKKVFISLAIDDTVVICNVTFETDVIDIPVVILIVAISDSVVVVVVLNKVGSTGCVQL